MMKLSQSVRALLGELQRRRVFKVTALYAAVAWALIEGANTILPRLSLPDWSVTLVIVLALAGLPLTVVIAWAYDVTPEGVRRTEPQEGSLVQAPRMAPTMLLLLFVGVLVAAGFIARGL